MAQGRPWQGHPKTGSEEKTQPPTMVGHGLGWTPGTRFPAPLAAALTSSSPWGSSLCVSPLTHYIFAPTGTNSVTTLPELLCQVSSRASSAWTTLRVSPELSDLGPGIAVPGGGILPEGTQTHPCLHTDAVLRRAGEKGAAQSSQPGLTAHCPPHSLPWSAELQCASGGHQLQPVCHGVLQESFQKRGVLQDHPLRWVPTHRMEAPSSWSHSRGV